MDSIECDKDIIGYRQINYNDNSKCLRFQEVVKRLASELVKLYEIHFSLSLILNYVNNYSYSLYSPYNFNVTSIKSVILIKIRSNEENRKYIFISWTVCNGMYQ
jgi:peptidoglycan biosynthesis protein MviN/MurJ (putative lipid II flippase)